MNKEYSLLLLTHYLNLSIYIASGFSNLSGIDMKKRTLQFFCFSIFLSLSPIHFAMAQFSQLYFPLETGNVWQYKEPGPGDGFFEERRLTGDSVLLNSQTYKILKTYNYGYPTPTDARFYRNEGSKVFEYLTFSSLEIVRFDFTKNVGDTIAFYKASIRDSAVTTVIEKGAHYFWGQMKNYMRFYEHYLSSSFYRIYEIADSIGLTFYQIEPGLQMLITGAHVNGKTFGTILKVEEPEQNSPDNFTLFQNYPNPFNPRTVIPYSLKKSAYVKLIAYDILGKEVYKMVDQKQEACEYEVDFIGKFSASGVYFYRMEVTDDKSRQLFAETKTMVLVK